MTLTCLPTCVSQCLRVLGPGSHHRHHLVFRGLLVWPLLGGERATLTYIDLEQHRREAIEALRRAGFNVDPMEDWSAASEEPSTASLDHVRDADPFVLLVALRRGYIPNSNEDLSITQLENREARRNNID